LRRKGTDISVFGQQPGGGIGKLNNRSCWSYYHKLKLYNGFNILKHLGKLILS